MGRIMSVEFDRSSIKAVEADRKGAVLSVLRCFSMDADTGIENGEINDVGLIADLLREELVRNNIKTKKVVFVVNSDCIITRNIRLPLLENSDDTLSMIKIELSQLIPIDFNQYIIKYATVEIVDNNDVKEAFYVIYCIPLKLFRDLGELAKRLNMRVACIYISSCCLSNIIDCNIDINGMQLNDKGRYAFIDINSQYISFCTLNKSVNDFSKLYFYDHDQYLNETVAESRHLYMEDSEDDSVFLKYELLDKINRCLKYYSSADNSNNINKLYIYGEGSKDNSIGSFLSQKLKTEIEDVNQVQNIYFDAMSVNENIISSSYLIPILSLFEGNTEMCLSINEGIEPAHHVGQLLFVCGAAVFLISCLGLKHYDILVSDKINDMSLFIGNEDNVRMNEKIENMKEEVAYLQGYLEQSAKLKALIDEEDFVSSVIFRDVFNAIPQHTRVTAISAYMNSIQLSCLSDTMEEVTLFLQNLREVNFIDELYLSDIDVKQDESGGYSYSVMCRLKDVSDSAP